MDKNEKILFEIKEHIGTISSNTNGWDKEINIVSWNDQKTLLYPFYIAQTLYHS